MSGADHPHAVPPTMPGPPQLRIMLLDTLISIAINGLAAGSIIWALGLKPPATPGGSDGQIVTLGRAIIVATFLMSLIVTALVRGRVAKGAPPLAAIAGLGWVPRLLPLRALFWVVFALLIILPAGLIAAHLLRLGHLDRTGFFLFNLLFGVMLSVGVTPFVVWIALTDGVRRRPA